MGSIDGGSHRRGQEQIAAIVCNFGDGNEGIEAFHRFFSARSSTAAFPTGSRKPSWCFAFSEELPYGDLRKKPAR
jgi:hypothetical protein